jgi:hypothetical protein
VRGWVLGLVIGVVGALVLAAVVAAVDNGRDNSGETVSASDWADDVCGTVGAWEGQLEAIRDELAQSNEGARQIDGGSGDHVERTLEVRSAIERALDATDQTLQEGLKRAGVPDVAQGPQAAAILADWALETENGLLAARATLRREPDRTSAALSALGVAVAALRRSAVDGRAAFRQVAALDEELADALADEQNCQELMKEQP